MLNSEHMSCICSQLQEFDSEPHLFKDRLFEYEVTFPPRWVLGTFILNFDEIHLQEHREDPPCSSQEWLCSMTLFTCVEGESFSVHTLTTDGGCIVFFCQPRSENLYVANSCQHRFCFMIILAVTHSVKTQRMVYHTWRQGAHPGVIGLWWATMPETSYTRYQDNECSPRPHTPGIKIKNASSDLIHQVKKIDVPQASCARYQGNEGSPDRTQHVSR